jgi:hypothetical protein
VAGSKAGHGDCGNNDHDSATKAGGTASSANRYLVMTDHDVIDLHTHAKYDGERRVLAIGGLALTLSVVACMIALF